MIYNIHKYIFYKVQIRTFKPSDPWLNGTELALRVRDGPWVRFPKVTLFIYFFILVGTQND